MKRVVVRTLCVPKRERDSVIKNELRLFVEDSIDRLEGEIDTVSLKACVKVRKLKKNEISSCVAKYKVSEGGYLYRCYRYNEKDMTNFAKNNFCRIIIYEE